MTQDERWLARYNEVMGFLELNHRNPSKHRIEEHDHLNWLKAGMKLTSFLCPFGSKRPKSSDTDGFLRSK